MKIKKLIFKLFFVNNFLKMASIGIEWRMQTKFYWLELHIKNPKMDY